MLEELLAKDEGKTLEFKENTKSLQKIIQTLIAFANTAGGTLIIGVKDKTKEVVGLEDALKDEEKIANAISDCIAPLLVPTIQLYTYRKRDVLIVTIPHWFGPYHLKSEGIENGTFVRLGSTNRLADAHTIYEIQRLREQKYFDEQPCVKASLDDIDMTLAKKLFAKVKKKFTEKTAQSLGLYVPYHSKLFPSNGAILLFGKHHGTFFPDAIIRLARFIGTTKAEVLDHQDVEAPLVTALDPILTFIRRNTAMAAKFGAAQREDIPQYPTAVVREAAINALLHTDYSIKGASIQIAIFDDRMEITNPGGLPRGLDLETALAGVSQLRNRVIGHVFRELNLIEAWGSGFGRMISICLEQGIPRPKFEELGNFFRVTLYHRESKPKTSKESSQTIINFLEEHKKITAKKAQEMWGVTSRTASSRLKKMVEQGKITEIGTSSFDPLKIFKLPR